MADTPQTRTVDVPTLLSTIADQLSQNQGQLNNVDGAGTHGNRVAAAFSAAANAAADAGSADAGEQLAAAADAMRQRGSGKAASFYADGLEQAAADFKGQASISADNLLPFLQSFLGGIQANNPARAGQGTMLDAIQPAVNAVNQVSRSGQTTEKGLLDILGAAIGGTQQTASNGTVDPGAASATNVIGGIITAVAPTLISMLLSHGGSSQGQGGGAAGGLGGLLGGLLGGGQGSGSGSAGGIDIGGLLGGLMGGGQGQSNSSDYEGYQTQQQNQQQNQQQGGGGFGGDLGGLLGGLMGGQQSGAQSSQSSGQQSGGGDLGWLGGLLGGLAGGGQGSGSNSGSQGGVDLGGLLGGLMGGRSGELTDEEDPRAGRGGTSGGSY